MVILMKSNKTLTVSVETRLYQKENCVDKLIFYVPETYKEHKLEEFTAAVYYVNQGNEAYTEILTPVESSKDGFLEYKLPVNTKFTAIAGPVTLMLSFVKNDEETNTQYVLHTSSLTINIETWKDYYQFIPDESLSAIDNRILELSMQANQLKEISDNIEKATPDDLILDNDILHLSKEGKALGSGVEILTPGDPDHEDQDHDGIIDIDSLNSANGLSAPIVGYTFVEL